MSPLHTYCSPPIVVVVVYLLEIGPLTPSGNQKALTPLKTPHALGGWVVFALCSQGLCPWAGLTEVPWCLERQRVAFYGNFLLTSCWATEFFVPQVSFVTLAC